MSQHHARAAFHQHSVLTFTSWRARTIFAGCVIYVGNEIVVAGVVVRASKHFVHIANAVGIVVGLASASTNSDHVHNIAVAITLAGGDVFATALVNGTRTVAQATFVHHANAVVHIVTEPIGIDIGSAFTAAHSNGVQLLAITIARPFWQRFTSTFQNGSCTIAHTTFIKCSDAVVHIVAHPIVICVCRARTSADAEGIVVQTSPVVHGGVHVKIACQVVVASIDEWPIFAKQPCAVKLKSQQHAIRTHAQRENLCVDCPRKRAGSCDLGHQHLHVFIGHGVGCVVQHVPGSSNHRIGQQ